MTAGKTGNYLAATACVSIWHLAHVQYTAWRGGKGVTDPSHTQFQNSLKKVYNILLKIDLDNGK